MIIVPKLLLKTAAGVLPPGCEVEVDTKIARPLISSGLATEIKPTKKAVKKK